MSQFGAGRGKMGAFRSKRMSPNAYDGNRLTIQEEIVSVVISTKTMRELGGAAYGGGAGNGLHGKLMSALYGNEKYCGKKFPSLFRTTIDNEVLMEQAQAAIAAATNAGWDRPSFIIPALCYDRGEFKSALRELPPSVANKLQHEYNFGLDSIPKENFQGARFERQAEAQRTFTQYANLAAKNQKRKDAFVRTSPYGAPNRRVQVTAPRSHVRCYYITSYYASPN